MAAVFHVMSHGRFHGVLPPYHYRGGGGGLFVLKIFLRGAVVFFILRGEGGRVHKGGLAKKKVVNGGIQL